MRWRLDNGHRRRHVGSMRTLIIAALALLCAATILAQDDPSPSPTSTPPPRTAGPRSLADAGRSIKLQRTPGAAIVVTDDGMRMTSGAPNSIGEEEFFGDVDEPIQQACAAKYPADSEMRSFCREQQHDAVRALQARKPWDLGVSESDFVAARAFCRRRYSTEYDMRDYCEGQQVQAMQRMAQRKAEVEGIPPEALEIARAECRKKHPEDFEMRDYCETQWVKLFRP